MIGKQLDRLIRFVQDHRERLVVLDPLRDEPVVVLPFDEYEQMKADWDPPFEPEPMPPAASGLDWDGDELWNESWNDPTIDNFKPADVEVASPEPAAAPQPALVPEEPASVSSPRLNTSDSAGDNLSDIPHEEEEEKFYLEPVE